MQITSIRMKKLNNKYKNIIAIASVMFDNCLVVHGIKLIKKDDKIIIGFPSERTHRVAVNNGNYIKISGYSDVVHPSNSEFRKYISDTLLDFYNKNDESEVEKKDEQ